MTDDPGAAPAREPSATRLDAVIARVDPPPEVDAATSVTLGDLGRYLTRWERLSGGHNARRPVLLTSGSAAPGVLHDLRTLHLPAGSDEGYVDATLAAVDRAVDGGADAFILCDSTEPSTATRAAAGLLTNADAAAVTGHEADDEVWMTCAAAIRDQMRHARPLRGAPVEMLAALAADDVGPLAIALVGAAARRVPVILDGTTSLTAALVAMRLAHRGRGWWFASHRPDDPAAGMALGRLDLEPLVDLGLRRGGVGSLLVLRLLQP